uniref:Uncharacterized protein n=1 Tax=Schistosoma haematobium TaxID=6185 RepID=A0A094ZCR0_SCHHA
MTYVEKRLILRNGPPWGFRLYEDFMEGLIVAKINVNNQLLILKQLLIID